MTMMCSSVLCWKELEGIGQCERETSWELLQGSWKGDDGDNEWLVAIQVEESG